MVDHFLLSEHGAKKFKLSQCSMQCHCRVCNGILNKGDLRIGSAIVHSTGKSKIG